MVPSCGKALSSMGKMISLVKARNDDGSENGRRGSQREALTGRLGGELPAPPHTLNGR